MTATDAVAGSAFASIAFAAGFASSFFSSALVDESGCEALHPSR